MSHDGYDAGYMVCDENRPAYTWTSAPVHMSYRSPQTPLLNGYKAWDAGSSPEQDSTILHSPPMTYDSSPLTFSNDLTPELPVNGQPTTAITLDEHCYANPENLPNKDALKAARKVARRPNPVAIPNLTKKARGRPVPTKDTLLKPGSGRAYACPVQDCRKVFTRAEHLKRHTRSIHTNEKPFKCEEPNCGRLFTRHDNLLQHIKNHRSSPSIRDMSAEYGPLDRVHIARSSSEDDQSHVSPSMGVLIPPSISAVPMTLSPQIVQQHYEVVDFRGPLGTDASDAPSPDSSPAPSEPSYLNYSYGCPWPQSDIRSIPPPTYTVIAEPRYPQSSLISATGGYAYET